jgi:hypothetical protein
MTARKSRHSSLASECLPVIQHREQRGESRNGMLSASDAIRPRISEGIMGRLALIRRLTALPCLRNLVPVACVRRSGFRRKLSFLRRRISKANVDVKLLGRRQPRQRRPRNARLLPRDRNLREQRCLPINAPSQASTADVRGCLGHVFLQRQVAMAH